jgi:hypothetical protein
MNRETYIPETKISKVEPTETSQEILAEPKTNYELDQIEHDFVSRYKPKFLAKGGEHIVYEIPEHPDIVVKVSTAPLKRILEWNAQHGLPIDSLPAELELRARDYLKAETARYQLIKNHFGFDHVPNQKEFLVKVPITQEILNSLYDGNPPATTGEVWSVVMVQKQVEALNDTERLTLVAGYAENEEVPENVYNQATEHFVFGKNTEEAIDREKFLKVQSHKDLKVLIEKSGEDENLRVCLKELVEKIITYTEETGEIFDLAGQDNIVLFQKDGNWTYSLVDARYPGESKMVDRAKIALLSLSAGIEIEEHEKNILLNMFNFVRTINGLAEQVGAQGRVNIIPEEMTDINTNFLQMLSSGTPNLLQKNEGVSVPVENESSTEEKLDRLHNTLDNRTIKNSDGVDVTLHVTREKFMKTKEEMWYITFEYEYKGKLINRRYPQTDNYVQLVIEPETNTITVGMAQLETQVLKGKNVYPQVVELLGESFPNDFTLEAEFGHEATKKNVLEAKAEYQQGQIDIEQFKQKVLQSYLFRTRIASGFNNFELSFTTNSSGEVIIKVNSSKSKNSNQPKLVILGL